MRDSNNTPTNQEEKRFLSVRNIAEYLYCPRLFYFLEIEGTKVANADTEEGVFVHRNVDKETKYNPEQDLTDSKKVTSMILTDEELGLMGRLDLVELNEDGSTVPTEYRKGKPQKKQSDILGEGTKYIPWPSDLLQLTLQAMLLKRNGYVVTNGYIYYKSSNQKLEINFDQSFEEDALRLIGEIRSLNLNKRPPPLVNSPKCNRCSLQKQCLPDEINYEDENNEAVSPRKIWPPLDDGIHIVSQSFGASVGVNEKFLHISDKDGKRVQEIPSINIESFTVFGNTQISTQAIAFLASQNIPISFVSYSGRLIATIQPYTNISTLTRRSQVKVFEDEKKCLELSKALIKSKIANQRTLLRRNCQNLEDHILKELDSLMHTVNETESLNSLRGVEGLAASIYFQHFHKAFPEGISAKFEQNGREKRPAPDPINSCLSFSYTMLMNECISALKIANLEPAIGVLHCDRPGRPSLALDLMEPFRPLIADSVTITMFNRKELTDKDFIFTGSGCVFTDVGSKKFFNTYSQRMTTEITHPIYKYKLSYRRMIYLHARMISAWLVGDVTSLNFLTTR